MILITGTVVVAEENRAAFLKAATHHVALSREEPGCTSHGVFEDQMSPGTFTFVERWRDMEAVQEHFAMPYSKETVLMLRKLAVSSTGVEIHEIASTRVVEARRSSGKPGPSWFDGRSRWSLLTMRSLRGR